MSDQYTRYTYSMYVYIIRSEYLYTDLHINI